MCLYYRRVCCGITRGHAPNCCGPRGGALGPPVGAEPATSQALLRGVRSFLGQCHLLFQFQPSRFWSDGAKVALILSSLTDRALDWAMAAVGNNPQLSTDLQQFSNKFKRVFDHPTNGANAAGRLHNIQQGPRGIAEYTLEFRTLMADSGWDDNALWSAYRRGLTEEMKDLLVRDRPPTFNSLVTLALQVDERLRERHMERAQRSGSSAQTPVTRPGGRYIAPLGPTPVPPLSPSRAPLTHPQEEEEPVLLATLPVLWEGGAHYPGLSGPAKRSGSLGGGVLVSRTDIIPPSGGTNNLFPASLAWSLESLSVGALLDSGTDECLIDVTLARQAGIPLKPMEATLSAQAQDGHSLGKITHRTVPLSLTHSGNHMETIEFLVLLLCG